MYSLQRFRFTHGSQADGVEIAGATIFAMSGAPGTVS